VAVLMSLLPVDRERLMLIAKQALGTSWEDGMAFVVEEYVRDAVRRARRGLNYDAGQGRDAATEAELVLIDVRNFHGGQRGPAAGLPSLGIGILLLLKTAGVELP
jgi:hypothetical protein